LAAVGTRAVLLRAYAFGETSRILRFYTESFGLVSVVARGVRGRSGKGGLTLATFATGELTAYVQRNRDLQTMKDFACTHARSRLGSGVIRFAGASAVAELVVAHADQEPNRRLFDALERALDDLEELSDHRVVTASLAGAWTVVEALGFAPELDACTRCGRPLSGDEVGRFDLAAGGVVCEDCGQDGNGPRVGPIAREQLRRLVSGRSDPPITHARRHLALLSDFVTFHVAQKPLKSLRFLGDLLPDQDEP
jgi:DNA repair protein RecO